MLCVSKNTNGILPFQSFKTLMNRLILYNLVKPRELKDETFMFKLSGGQVAGIDAHDLT